MSGRVLRRLGDLLLTAGAVVGALCLVVAVAGVVVGVKPLVFRSGSMAPTIDVGALALAHRVDAADLAVGDVVSVAAGGSRVTHRVVGIERTGGDVALTLRGDANDAPDPRPYVVASADRVWFAIPHLGGVLDWLSSPPGLLLLGGYGALLLGVLLRRPADREPGPPGAAPRRRRRSRPALLCAAVAGATVAAATPTWAWWTDDVVVSGTSITAQVPAPGPMTCALANPPGGGGYANLTFTVTLPAGTGAVGSGSRYEYVVDFRRMDNNAAQGFTPTVTLSGTTLTIAFDDGDIDSAPDITSIDYWARVTVRAATAPSWTAGVQRNFDASDQILAFPLGGPDRYGSPTGTTSPGGQPGQCSA